MMKIYLTAIILSIVCTNASAARIPDESLSDPRIRYVDYDEDQIYLINVRRGNLTRIILGKDETILKAGYGFTSNCEDAQEWCITADEGERQIWVKPYEGATHNNLEIATNKRNYSFEFKVMPDAPKGRWSSNTSASHLSREPFSRVVFLFETAEIDAPESVYGQGGGAISKEDLLASSVDSSNSLEMRDVSDASNERVVENDGESITGAGRSKSSKPGSKKNFDYDQTIGEGAESIRPSLVFDNGIFTYFKYPANRPVPAIFAVNAYGEESRVNPHMEKGDLYVVRTRAAQFVLRRGRQVISIWNNSYDVDGVNVGQGVTDPMLKRVLR